MRREKRRREKFCKRSERDFWRPSLEVPDNILLILLNPYLGYIVSLPVRRRTKVLQPKRRLQVRRDQSSVSALLFPFLVAPQRSMKALQHFWVMSDFLHIIDVALPGLKPMTLKHKLFPSCSHTQYMMVEQGQANHSDTVIQKIKKGKHREFTGLCCHLLFVFTWSFFHMSLCPSVFFL